MATAKQLDELTECSICTEVYTDPRVLPCGHTFCLTCLVEFSQDKQPGDRLACPLCRKEFTLSNDGVRDLTKNYMVANVLQMRETASKMGCEQFLQQMTSDSDNVTVGVQKCREMLDSLQKEEKKFNEQVANAELIISGKTGQLKLMIDAYKDQLVLELSSRQQRRMSEIESLREEIKNRLSSMGNYKQTVDEVVLKGADNDISRAATVLHDRADELLRFDVIENALAELGHADVRFTSSGFVLDDVSKTLGQLHYLNVAKEGKRSYISDGP